MTSRLSCPPPASTKKSLLRDKGGATAVEYALMLVAILIIVAGAFKTLGNKVSEKANSAASQLE
ncbi:MAG: Flp family type IVb pilin [Myxococcales bacterium]|nr:Flp family type IVb pilin [Myxococcales bacterium]